MERIIYIETATSLCTTALSENGEVVCTRESVTAKSQASMTIPLIAQMLHERGLSVKDCDAICVSKGPGSYTGLRVGSSTAKGLCFGASLPLIAVGTLDTLVWGAVEGGLLPDGCNAIVPMIDARRMEVYSAIFTPDGKQMSETSPLIVDGSSFAEQLEQGPVLFIGDGADKCRGTIMHPNARFFQCCPRAEWMVTPATAAFKERRFENTAYFEPFYLKQFVATVIGKKLF